MAFQIINSLHFNDNISEKSYRFIEYTITDSRDIENNVTFFYDQVMHEMLETSICKTTGLSFFDLLELDYTTFKDLSTKIRDFDEKHKISGNPGLDQLLED